MSLKYIGFLYSEIKKAIRVDKLLPQEEFVDENDLQYISSARAAVLQQTPRGGQHLLWCIFIFFVSILVWASWAKVDEFSRGEGKVIPSQQVQVIQNLEGGILAELHVKEGESVSRGQPLLRIDDTRFSSSLREAGVTLAQLEIKTSRLRAEAQGLKFVPSENWESKLLAREMAFYTSRQNELNGNLQVLRQQVSQKRQEVSELEARQSQMQTSYNLLQEELELTRPLLGTGSVSQVEFLRLQRQLNDVLGELTSAKLAIPRARSSLIEIQEKYSNIELAFQRDAREQLNALSLELSQLKETSEALVDRVQRTLVKSPVAGTVKRLLVTTIGGVIQPGMDIIEVVPSEDVLLVETRIRPADIAFLHPGQKAKVKFTAYDFAIMGGLDGELVHISPDTILDENGDSYYLVRVETSRSFAGPDGRPLPIISGMTVSVDVLTGKKTILDYLLKPILKTKQLALRER